MKFEEKREFPVSLKEMWDFTMDFHEWPLWYAGMLGIVEPEMGAWAKPGDSVRIAYKMMGRRIEYTCTVSEWKEHELLDFVAEPPALPAAHFRWHWQPLGEGRAQVIVELETDEPTTFFGKVIEKTQIPRIYHRDMVRSLDNLEEIAMTGIPR
ncbi:MAG: SRPBCC family protein [Actinomycetia bacterium]|nr:SRPBCC family protein [Actinomycetes bacterium]